MPRERSKYHHGDLHAALIQAADDIIAEGGIEAFSLRAAAGRAGVSPGAPAHHFGNAKGLLTEVGLLAFERFGRSIEEIGRTGDPVADVRALGLAFVAFAVDNPGHFRLMFRNDLVNRNDPRYPEVAVKPGMRLARAIAAYNGRSEMDMGRFDDAADVFLALSTLHGLANLVLAEKTAPFFENATAREFVVSVLPRVIERLYPPRNGLGSIPCSDP